MSGDRAACDVCRSRIADADLESGRAIILLGKTYCARCKSEAVKNISLEDVAAADPGGGAGLPTSTPAAARAPARPRRPSTVRALPPPPARRKAHVPFLIAGGVGVVGVIVFVIATSGRPSGPPRPEPAQGAGGAAVPPEVRAQRAFEAAQRVAGAASSNDDAIKALDGAAPACRGTSWELRLRELRTQYVRRREDAAALEDLRRRVDEIRALVAGDPNHARYGEVMAKVLEARQVAAKVAPASIPEIQKLVAEYSERYEKQAEPHYVQVSEAATALANEKRYDDALKVIETFPASFRQSNAWKNLESLKRQIQNRKRVQ